jgi:hypothetical protein
MSAVSSQTASRSGTPPGQKQPPKGPSPSTFQTTSSRSSSSSDVPFASNYFSYPVTRVVSGLYRRLTDPSTEEQPRNANTTASAGRSSVMTTMTSTSSSSSVYTPRRTASPFQPPPLTPLILKSSAVNDSSSSSHSHHILTRALAEEIRLLVPPRLQLVDTWRLAYSLERDGSSLATLYETCRQISHRSPRAGYVLVVRDTSGGAIFGAYLTDPPHPASHFYGTGECFLWRASILASTPMMVANTNGGRGGGGGGGDARVLDDEEQRLSHPLPSEEGIMTDEELRKAGFPPPPSADTTYAVRSTTLRAGTPSSLNEKNNKPSAHSLLTPPDDGTNRSSSPGAGGRSGTSTPERIRFKAFPYSGVNDYMIFCETGFLSVGGGWVSLSCLLSFAKFYRLRIPC